MSTKQNSEPLDPGGSAFQKGIEDEWDMTENYDDLLSQAYDVYVSGQLDDSNNSPIKCDEPGLSNIKSKVKAKSTKHNKVLLNKANPLQLKSKDKSVSQRKCDVVAGPSKIKSKATVKSTKLTKILLNKATPSQSKLKDKSVSLRKCDVLAGPSKIKSKATIKSTKLNKVLLNKATPLQSKSKDKSASQRKCDVEAGPSRMTSKAKFNRKKKQKMLLNKDDTTPSLLKSKAINTSKNYCDESEINHQIANNTISENENGTQPINEILSTAMILRPKDFDGLQLNDKENQSEGSETPSLFGGDFSDDDPTYQPDNVKAASECDSDDSQLIQLDELLNPEKVYTAEENRKLQWRKGIQLVFGKKSESHQIAELIMFEIVQRCWKILKPSSRRRIADPSSWKVNIAKKRKASGLPYQTKKKCRSPKVPKLSDCSKCRYKCNDHVTESDRQVLCRKYWNLDFAERKSFILRHVSINSTKTVLKERKRPTTRAYVTKCYFVIKGEKKKVCQKFFCKTLNISPAVVSDAIKRMDDFGCYTLTQDPRGRKEPPNKTVPEKVEDVKRHIASFPTMESHYIRKNSKRKYLDAKLSLCKMYALYVQECKEKDSTPVSEMTYRRIFATEFNLGFFIPKKDQCLLCTKYQRANAEERAKLQIEYQNHIERKEKCNKEKADDKIRAENEPHFLSATFDLQAILQVPSTEVGLLYYTRKLTIYNLTLYESALPNEAYCFVWSEVHGKKGSSEIGTILWHYLTQCLPETVTEVSLFSDTCGGQNRNQYVAAILLWIVNNCEQLQVLEHKFLESGHSYMEADSMHSAIESAKKYRDVYCVSDWISIFKEARSKELYKKGNKKVKKAKYNVKELKYNDFKDLKTLASTVILNKTKNTEGQKVQWLKIKRMKFIKGDRNIYYNYDMSTSFMSIDVTSSGTEKNPNTDVTSVEKKGHGYATRRKTRLQQVIDQPSVSLTSREFCFPPLRQLYSNPLPISEAKKKDLVSLCNKGVIPDEYHGWFKSLPTEGTVIDRVPDLTVSDVDSVESASEDE